MLVVRRIVALIVGIGLVFLLPFPAPPMGGIVIAIALLSWPEVRAWLAIRKFCRALAPMLLPAAALVLAGADSLSQWELALMGAGAVALAWYVVLRPEQDALKRRWAGVKNLARSRRSRRVELIDLVRFGVAVTFFLVFLLPIFSVQERLREVGGWPALFVACALLLALFALVARLVALGDVITGFVGLVVLGFVAWRLGVRAEVLPGWTWQIDLRVLLILGLLGILLLVVRPPASPAATAARPGWSQLLNDFGLAGAMLSAIVLPASILVVTSGEEDVAEVRVASTVKAHLLEPSEATDLELARAYTPVLRLTQGQRWGPTSVYEYLNDATLLVAGGENDGDLARSPGDNEPLLRNGVISPNSRNKDHLDILPDSCRGDTPSPCYRLTIGCKEANEGCATEGEDLPLTSPRDPTVYARVLRRDGPDGGLLKDRGPWGKTLTTLVQYWLFYRYDEWLAWTVMGTLVQRHEADWEAVTIGFARRSTGSRERPVFVAYSSHCGGSWRPWQTARVFVKDDGGPVEAHPVAYVAEGSQANYPEHAGGRAPDWAGCGGARPRTGASLSYAANIRDLRGTHWTVEFDDNDVFIVRGDYPLMRFPGFWGDNDATWLQTYAGGFHHLASGTGPKTPSHQDLWRSPLRTIFCSSLWQPEGGKVSGARLGCSVKSGRGETPAP
jgi:hypothetical protein